MTSLICKLNNLPIKNSLYGGKVKAPNKAFSFDLVKIAKDNGDKIDIITFRDKTSKPTLGKIIRRYIIKKERWGETFIERNYSEQKEITMPDPKQKNEKLLVKGRLIKSITKFNDEYFEKSSEIQTVAQRKNNKPVLNISKLISKPFGKAEIENETQTMFQYSKDMPKKGYEINTLLKSRLGFITDVIEPVYKFIGFTEKQIEKFKQDNYFPLHLYSFEEFKKFAPTVANHPNHKTVMTFETFWFKEMNTSRLGFFDGDINLNSDKLNTRFDIINTSAHEKEHAYQLEQCIFYDLKSGIKNAPAYVSEDLFQQYRNYYINGGKCKINDKLEVQLTKHDYENYVNSDKNTKLYQDQFVEMSARIAGGLAESDYKKSADAIKKEFPYAPDYMLGYTDSDRMLRAWKILHS